MQNAWLRDLELSWSLRKGTAPAKLVTSSSAPKLSKSSDISQTKSAKKKKKYKKKSSTLESDHFPKLNHNNELLLDNYFDLNDDHDATRFPNKDDKSMSSSRNSASSIERFESPLEFRKAHVGMSPNHVTRMQEPKKQIYGPLIASEALKPYNNDPTDKTLLQFTTSKILDEERPDWDSSFICGHPLEEGATTLSLHTHSTTSSSMGTSFSRDRAGTATSSTGTSPSRDTVTSKRKGRGPAAAQAVADAREGGGGFSEEQPPPLTLGRQERQQQQHTAPEYHSGSEYLSTREHRTAPELNHPQDRTSHNQEGLRETTAAPHPDNAVEAQNQPLSESGALKQWGLGAGAAPVGVDRVTEQVDPPPHSTSASDGEPVQRTDNSHGIPTDEPIQPATDPEGLPPITSAESPQRLEGGGGGGGGGGENGGAASHQNTRSRSQSQSLSYTGSSHAVSTVTLKIRRELIEEAEKMWTKMVSELRGAGEDIQYAELAEIASLHKSTALVQPVVIYLGVLLGIRPDWDSMKRTLFRQLFPLLKFLREVDPATIPHRRLRKAIRLKRGELGSTLLASASDLHPALAKLLRWVLAFNTVARLLISAEKRRKDLLARQQASVNEDGTGLMFLENSGNNDSSVMQTFFEMESISPHDSESDEGRAKEKERNLKFGFVREGDEHRGESRGSHHSQDLSSRNSQHDRAGQGTELEEKRDGGDNGAGQKGDNHLSEHSGNREHHNSDAGERRLGDSLGRDQHPLAENSKDNPSGRKAFHSPNELSSESKALPEERRLSTESGSVDVSSSGKRVGSAHEVSKHGSPPHTGSSGGGKSHGKSHTRSKSASHPEETGLVYDESGHLVKTKSGHLMSKKIHDVRQYESMIFEGEDPKSYPPTHMVSGVDLAMRPAHTHSS